MPQPVKKITGILAVVWAFAYITLAHAALLPPVKVQQTCNALGDSHAVAEYNAACANSYLRTGDQGWYNLNQSPAIAITDDAEAEGPLYLGGSASVTASDPVFTGTIGRPGAYYAMSGAQFFAASMQDDNSPAALPDGWLDNLHKSGGSAQDFGDCEVLRYVNTGEQTLASTTASDAGEGIRFYIDGSRKLNLKQTGDSTSSTATGTNALTAGKDYGLCVAHTGTTTTFWVLCDSSPCGTTGEDHTQTYAAATASASSPLLLGVTLNAAQDTASAYLGSGTRFYGRKMWNGKPSDTQIANFRAQLETFNSLDLTP